LRARINDFFRKIRANGKFSEIYNRYYGNLDAFNYLDLQLFQRRVGSNLPKYHQIIQAAAEKHGFDWRLITAQLYQESHFWPRARSHAGAYGLMQLTQSTAESLGVADIYAPEENIPAGVKHLKALYDRYDRAIGEDRLFIALAAYNIGQGHIQDARALARKRGLNPEKWASLKTMLLLLKTEKYYQQAQYGYCRGNEPITYVKQIMIYYDILKQQAFEAPNPAQQISVGF
jgi:membrane-bound lytic murein transglycosylase F